MVGSGPAGPCSSRGGRAEKDGHPGGRRYVRGGPRCRDPRRDRSATSSPSWRGARTKKIRLKYRQVSSEIRPPGFLTHAARMLALAFTRPLEETACALAARRSRCSARSRSWPSPGRIESMARIRDLATAVMTAAAVWAPGTVLAATTPYDLVSDVRIPMSDGVLLDSDEYVPTTGCPCPTILVQTPYRKSGAGVSEGNTIFPSNGYAMIVVDVRGTGSSEGMWDSFGAREQQDSVALVQRAASRPFSNGVVGLSGVSYSAINQFLTVEQPGTQAAKAIFPIVPMSDAYRDVTWATFPAGGTYDLVQRGEPILFRGLKLSTARKKLMIGPWYHTSAGNGLTADDGSNPVYDTKGNLLPSLNNLQLAWFDRWLKGISNGIDAFPAVETYYLGAGKWAPDTKYPASRTTYRRWYLSATPGSGTSLYAGSLAPAADGGNTTVTL